MTTLPTVRVDERCARRLKEGYPWVFRSEVGNPTHAGAFEPGTLVNFLREKGDFAGRGFYNPKPQLVGRVLTSKSYQDINLDFFKSIIQQSLTYRDHLFSKPYYRLIHAEGDGLPGLIVDRYNDVLVVQVNTAGMEKLFALIQEALVSTLKPRAILLRNDSPAREQEGLALESKVIHGELTNSKTTILENNCSFDIDLLEGQKTGWFFDQRDNRAWIAQLSKGKSMIDVFCHTGGFGLTALKNGALSATFIDSSDKALADAQHNASLNQLSDRCTFIKDKAFEALEKLTITQTKFGVVSLDPPAFIKTRKDMNSGLKGYQKLAKLAAPLVEAGGFLFLASCSHHAATADLLANVSEGLAKAGRSFQLIKTSGASADHPAHSFLPETEYLKGLTFRFLD